MDWYYALNEEQKGPIGEAEFQSLAQSGVITPTTLVWHQGLAQWQPYGQLFSAEAEAAQMAACSECGRTLPQEEMIRYQNAWVCGSCKATFVQKLKEGLPVAGGMKYAGFWIRFGAKMIDTIIMWVIQAGLAAVAAFGTAILENEVMLVLLVNILPIILYAGYTTFFIGKYQATLGKMAVQVKVVMDDGGTVTYGRALGRHFAEMISGIILAIGYIMAAWDPEKRTLHDRICSTRVVFKK